MGFTVIAFIDLQFKDDSQWKGVDQYREDGTVTAINNHAEISLVVIDGTERHLFFKDKSLVRITGNTIWFNSKDSDYLMIDHDKK